MLTALMLALLSPAQEKQQETPIAIEAVRLNRPADFATDILPILRSSCLACHNTKDKKGDLVLETPAAMIKGGESGPAIVPGKADQSLLLAAASLRKEPPMPPAKNKSGAKRLTPRELGILKLWIDEGARDSIAKPLDPPLFRPAPAGWNPIFAVALDPGGQIAACGRAGKLFIYHVPTGRLISQPSDPKLDGVAHRDSVQAIAFSPEGALFATGGYRSIKIWERQRDDPTVNLDSGEFRAAAVSPDGKRVALAGESVQIIELDSRRRTTIDVKEVNALDFSPDGAAILLVSGKAGAVWKPGAAEPSHKLEWPEPVTAIDWFGDGTQVATGHADGTVRFWKVDAAATALKQQVKHGAPVAALAVYADGKRVVVAGGAGGAKLWEIDGKKPLDLTADELPRRFDREAQARVAFRAAEVKYREQQIKAAEETKTKEEGEVKKAVDGVPPIEKAFQEKEAALAKAKTEREASEKALADAQTALDEAKKGAEEKDLKAAEAKLKEAEKKPAEAKKAEEAAKAALDSARLAFESAKRRVEKAGESAARAVQEIEEAKAKLAADKRAHAEAETERKQAADALAKGAVVVRSIALSPDGSLIALGGEDGRIHAYGAKGEEAGVIGAGGRPAIAAGFSGEGAVVSIGTDGGRIRPVAPAWKLARVIEPPPGESPADRVMALAFSPDGKLLASGGGIPSREGEIVLWDPATGKRVRIIADVHSDQVFDLEFSPDGTLLASCAADKFAKICDVAQGKVVRAFEGHTAHVLGVAWNRTGRTLATAGADDQVLVWNAVTGQRLKAVKGFDKQATALRYLGFEDRFAVTAGSAPLRIVTEAGTIAKNLPGAGPFTYAVAVSGDGRTLAAGGLDGTLRLWSAEGTQPFSQLAPPK